jgi:hypothetical protein
MKLRETTTRKLTRIEEDRLKQIVKAVEKRRRRSASSPATEDTCVWCGDKADDPTSDPTGHGPYCTAACAYVSYADDHCCPDGEECTSLQELRGDALAEGSGVGR